MSVDILKSTSINSDAQPVPFNCTIDIEHRHNHPVNSFHALSFKYLRKNARKRKIKSNQLFESGMTVSQAFAEFLGELRSKCIYMQNLCQTVCWEEWFRDICIIGGKNSDAQRRRRRRRR